MLSFAGESTSFMDERFCLACPLVTIAYDSKEIEQGLESREDTMKSKHWVHAALFAILMAVISISFPVTAQASSAPAVEINGKGFPSLEEAIEASEVGDTISLNSDVVVSSSVNIPNNTNIIIDFSGHTCTIVDAKDNKTEGCGIYIPIETSVLLKNGTIKVSENAKLVSCAIESHGDISLVDMSIFDGDCTDQPLSFPKGTVKISGDTDIISKSPEKYAFKVWYRSMNSHGSKGIRVEFDDSFTGEVSGTIIYFSDSRNKAILDVSGNGKFYCITTHSNTSVQPTVNIYGGNFVTIPISDDVAEGYGIVANPDGTYGVVSSDKIRTVIFDYGRKRIMVNVERGAVVSDPGFDTEVGYRYYWTASDGSRYDFTAPVIEDMILTAKKELVLPKFSLYSSSNSPVVGDEISIGVEFKENCASNVSLSYAWFKNGKRINCNDNSDLIYINDEGTYGVIVTIKDAEGNVVASDLTEISVNYTGTIMYRLYNRWSGEHLYTSDLSEYERLGQIGWNQEGVAWVAPSDGDSIYRVYNPYSGDHHYTLNAEERDRLVVLGWNDEGVGFYSAEKHGKAIYRLFNPYEKVGTHHYTSDLGEVDGMKLNGWNDEGVAWYALK